MADSPRDELDVPSLPSTLMRPRRCKYSPSASGLLEWRTVRRVPCCEFQLSLSSASSLFVVCSYTVVVRKVELVGSPGVGLDWFGLLSVWDVVALRWMLIKVHDLHLDDFLVIKVWEVWHDSSLINASSHDSLFPLPLNSMNFESVLWNELGSTCRRRINIP